jgi:hypothetical protein
MRVVIACVVVLLLLAYLCMLLFRVCVCVCVHVCIRAIHTGGRSTHISSTGVLLLVRRYFLPILSTMACESPAQLEEALSMVKSLRYSVAVCHSPLSSSWCMLFASQC